MTQARNITYGFHDTDIGRTLIGISASGLCWLSFITDGDAHAVNSMKRRTQADMFNESNDCTTLNTTKRSIDDFIAGKETALPALDVHGTTFQERVWTALLKIGRGQTVSYKDIARAVNKPTAARAIGGAVGANPVSLFIPCHRVLTHDGKIGGYAWGVERKQAILAAEGVLIKTP